MWFQIWRILFIYLFIKALQLKGWRSVGQGSTDLLKMLTDCAQYISYLKVCSQVFLQKMPPDSISEQLFFWGGMPPGPPSKSMLWVRFTHCRQYLYSAPINLSKTGVNNLVNGQILSQVFGHLSKHFNFLHVWDIPDLPPDYCNVILSILNKL